MNFFKTTKVKDKTTKIWT